MTITIQPASNKIPKHSIINSKSTGYSAAVGIGLTMISGASKNQTLHKGHKFFATFSLLSLATHIYLVLSKHRHN